MLTRTSMAGSEGSIAADAVLPLEVEVGLDEPVTFQIKAKKTESTLKILFAQPFFGIGVLNVLLIGLIYAFPLYTSELRAFGLSESQVVLLGVASQAGLGVAQYPLHRLYGLCSTRFPLGTADRIMSVVTCVLTVLPLTAILLILTFSSGEDSFGSLLVMFLCCGAGMGGTFSHTINVTNFNFMASPSVRRVGVAMVSVALGVGACIYVLAYHSLLPKVGLRNILVSQVLTLMLILGPRIMLFIRRRAHVEAVAQSDSDLEDSPTTPAASGQRQVTVLAVTPATWRDYYNSPVVWLTGLTSAFGIGVSATFLSSIGNLASNIEDSKELSEGLTFSITIAFLVSQLSARAISAAVYAYGKRPFIMAIWQLCILVGIGIFLFKSTRATGLISAVFVGLGFGGVWAAFPVITATSFPGDPSLDYVKGLSLVFFIVSVGSIAMGQAQTALLKVSSWAQVNPETYFTAFLFMFLVAMLSTVAAAFLGCKIR